MKNRKSSIELLKIIAIFLITISHVTQTLTSKGFFTNIGLNEGFIETYPTTDIKLILLMLMRHFGAFANIIFVICSSWFLIDSSSNKKGKVFKLVANTWIISIIMLGVTLVFGVKVQKVEIIKSIFPTTFENNWFITTYILFLLIVPYLNLVINKMDKKELFRATTVLLVLYFGIAFVKNAFGVSFIIDFIAIYFAVAYSKKYMCEFWDKRKNSYIIILTSILLMLILEIATIFSGIKIHFLKDKTLYWVKNNNPFFLFACLGIFFQVKKKIFSNRIINTISGQSLYIYLIHDNLIVRNHIRPQIWHLIYNRFGFYHVFIEILLFASALFIISMVLSIIYKLTLEKLVNSVIEKMLKSSHIKSFYEKVENKILKMN